MGEATELLTDNPRSRVCVINCTGGGEDPVVVGGWGTTASARAGAWVSGAGEKAIEANRPLLEMVRDAPAEGAEGVLEACEGYRTLSAVVRVLRRAVAQRRAALPPLVMQVYRQAAEFSPQTSAQETREAVARLLVELGHGPAARRLPEVPAGLAAAAKALEAARKTGRATAAQLRVDVGAAVKAAGAWADAVELYYGELAGAVDQVLAPPKK